MKGKAQKPTPVAASGSNPRVDIGVFSKRDAARLIASGSQHVHSTALGEQDPGAKVTRELLEGKARNYAWELPGANTLELHHSTDRQVIIQTIVQKTGLTSRRNLSGKVTSVLEEILTNSIYHSYHKGDGGEKYSRRTAVHLKNEESLRITFKEDRSGIYLAVQDQGGSLGFDKISKSLGRCYGGDQAQIESKESGAGLGLYMIFDIVTHLKFEIQEGKTTLVACWIADKNQSDASHFSFNFFGGKKK